MNLRKLFHELILHILFKVHGKHLHVLKELFRSLGNFLNFSVCNMSINLLLHDGHLICYLVKMGIESPVDKLALALLKKVDGVCEQGLDAAQKHKFSFTVYFLWLRDRKKWS